MQIIFLLIGIIGLVMFVFGIKTLIKNYRNEIISELKLTENEINFQKIGTYSISVVGGSYANNLGNFETQITHNETKLNTIEKNLKFKFHYKGRLATEFYSFEIENLGIHKIFIKNIEDLEVKESMLVSKRLFQKKLPIEKIGLIVKETSSSSKFIIGLLMTVFGINISIWGIILTFNPQLIG
ncbi:MAG: hypothetical protein L6Q46_10135 [Flavobacterium sp.]|uniref:hypothetical protein n=1 Tax=Flavobacterium sp. TaxID=239 RepID=UPI0025C6146B|nr:hypothetical protein [Flavobacterium sp.]MCK6608640.1 hypothetical protein [Flavobacterium sp.]